MNVEEIVVKMEAATEEEMFDPLADVDAGFDVKQEEVDDTSIHHLVDIKVEIADI